MKEYLNGKAVETAGANSSSKGLGVQVEGSGEEFSGGARRNKDRFFLTYRSQDGVYSEIVC